jgi:hypothetical protein
VCLCSTLNLKTATALGLTGDVRRRARPAKSYIIRFSESFAHPDRLEEECLRLGFDVIVAKREGALYRSGRALRIGQGEVGGLEKREPVSRELFNAS